VQLLDGDEPVVDGTQGGCEGDVQTAACVRNDVGLLSRSMTRWGSAFVGNFPQALSHIALLSCGVPRCRGCGNRRPR